MAAWHGVSHLLDCSAPDLLLGWLPCSLRRRLRHPCARTWLLRPLQLLLACRLLLQAAPGALAEALQRRAHTCPQRAGAGLKCSLAPGRCHCRRGEIVVRSEQFKTAR